MGRTRPKVNQAHSPKKPGWWNLIEMKAPSDGNRMIHNRPQPNQAFTTLLLTNSGLDKGFQVEKGLTIKSGGTACPSQKFIHLNAFPANDFI